MMQIVFESTCIMFNDTEGCHHNHEWELISQFSYDSKDLYEFCTKHLRMKSQKCGADKFKLIIFNLLKTHARHAK